ncbi:MAG: hypothetical protein ACYC2H_06480 [Thermoplasmatota archaeon]
MTPTLWLIFLGMSAANGMMFALIAFIIYKFVDMGRRWVIEVPSSPFALANIRRKRLRAGREYDRKSSQPGATKETVLVDPDATYPTLRGPLHIVAKETGFSLIAPPPNMKPAELEPDPVDPHPEEPHYYDEDRGTDDERELMVKANSKLRRDYEAALRTWRADNADVIVENEGKLLTWVRMVVCTPLLYWKAIQTNDHQDWLETQTGKDPWQVRVVGFLCLAFVVFMIVVGWGFIKYMEQQAKTGA